MIFFFGKIVLNNYVRKEEQQRRNMAQRQNKQNSKRSKEEEIKRNQSCAQDVTVTKIRDFTHVVKIEFGRVEAAEKALDKELMIFCMHVSHEQITRDEFLSLLACFNCYAFEDHTTRNCSVQTV